MIKLLFMDMHGNAGLARLPQLFKEQGALNYALAGKQEILLKSNALEGRYALPQKAAHESRRQMANMLGNACLACNPDFLLTNDENLIRNLLLLRRNLLLFNEDIPPLQKQILNLLNNSLLARDELYQRIDILEQARLAGFPVPDGFSVGSVLDLESHRTEVQFPCFLKANYVAGGHGVFHLTSWPELETAVADAVNTQGLLGESNPGMIQRETDGVEHNICFAAWQGQLLGYFVLRPLEKLEKFGLTSVVKAAYRPDLGGTIGRTGSPERVQRLWWPGCV